MNMIFSNYAEAEKQLRKHFDLPEKLKFKLVHKSYVEPAGNGHPSIVGLHQGYMPEYHFRSSFVAIAQKEIPKNVAGQWGMKTDPALPWIFVDTITWQELTEEEFLSRVKKILPD